MNSALDKKVVGVFGIGYVGLPVSVAFGRQYITRGFDISTARINSLRQGIDETKAVNPSEFKQSRFLSFTSDLEEMRGCDIYIVTIPTPVDEHNEPDLKPLLKASKFVGQVMAKDCIVVFESTVYPGVTEDECVPVLERFSHLKLNDDFTVGYSPERINPGDKEHRLDNVVKVVSASTPEALDLVDSLYSSIVNAGTCRTESIRIAEMAKVIENTQRDLNIALVNEIALICNKLNLDTGAVLEAANTKWNFLPFRPGLVGGHCIGVDPYYLTHKAKSIGHNPEVILAGRKINNEMPYFIAKRVKELLSQTSIDISSSKLLMLGLAFKENTPDIRNSKNIDLVRYLIKEGADVDVYDPLLYNSTTLIPTDIKMRQVPVQNTYDGIVLAVAHQEFLDLGVENIRSFGKSKCAIFDIKHVLPREMISGRL